nr:glycosyltransferase family 2 protein [uncultured Carboxylicivirga sp.]
MNISFIVIGRNEGERLIKCLNSIRLSIETLNLEAEIIYVDSQSTDHSIEIAKKQFDCRVFKITGKYNSAIARNIGVNESKSENLIFLDGDMELQSSFLPVILDEKGDLKYEFVSGNFVNYYYSIDGNLIHQDYYKKIYCAEDSYQSTTGGLFAIKRKLWNDVGGMNVKFKKGQDLDLGYRLARKGFLLLRKKEVMAVHHTIDYQEVKRLWKSFQSGAAVYPRAILYRTHFTNKYVLKRMLSSDPTLLVLLGSLLLTLLLQNSWLLLLYPALLVSAVVIRHRKKLRTDVFQRLIIHLFRDVLNLLAFFFFYPSNKIKVEYEEV